MECETSQKISQNPENLHSSIITPEKVHILQYHIGQTVLGKKCPRCGNDMILQFPQGQTKIGMEQIFWGCTGYYSTSCNHCEPYHHKDQNLLSPEEIPELSISNSELAEFFSSDLPAMKDLRNGVKKRMQEHIKQGTENYVCPVHCEKLILRQKKEFIGALDQFFLGCPMWRYGDKTSCQYMVKIKSPAQLAAILKDYEGRGIF
jgi:ssDNA-binding Zn-finger/Zn-ribbon topoisomerase 1